MRHLTKGISALKIHIFIAMLAIFAVACGGDGAGSTDTESSPSTGSSASSSAAPTPKPESSDKPAGTQGAKVDELIMGLISPTRDYFRSWVKGTADQVIKHDPMMEWLFEVSPVTNTFGPWLATEFEIAADSMSWNLKLAKGAKWNSSSGKDYGEFNAADVVHNHAIWCDPDYPGREDKPSSGYKVGMCAVETVEVVNDHEVNMVCSMPCPDLMFYYGEPTDHVQYSKVQWDTEGEQAYETHIAGTGPYIMTEHKLGESISYRKAPGKHWIHDVDWNGIKMTWVIEEATRLAQFSAGETHLTEVNKDLTDKLVSQGYKMVKSTGPAQQVQINFTGQHYGTEDESRDKFLGITGKLADHPFTNKDVRQAINKAIDRETIKEELYKGRVTSAYVHGYYEGLPGWDPTWADRFEESHGYDVEAAKALLKKAGYADGFSAEAWLFPFPGAPELIPVMEAVQVYLEEVNIKLTLQETDWAGTVIPKLRSREHGGVMWAIPPSKKVPETQIAGFNAGYNSTHQFETDELWETWDELRNTADLGKRDEILRKIGNIKYESFENVPLFEVYIEVIYDPNIVKTWTFPGWDGGDIGHTWLIEACKTADPCR